ncbi:MAG: hypothetical protein H7Y17_12295 [Chlorobia bacterium]|nr:hypothetical protein [Fimbriimonadaceae bacterium]
MAMALVGCSGGSSDKAPAKDESAFRNPPKQMPKEAQEAMARAMEKARNGPPPGATPPGG